ncbi:MAG: 50S ribosomal protein L30 [Candidatus Eisenbacteria bacterium]|nr:50S ribosomal protein L30 [Candidatus Eisenbacteria bacterium]
MAKLLRIQQTRSTINCKTDMKLTVKALGLRRIRHTVLQPDNPQIRGMVFKVKHLVRVEEIEA